MQKLQQKKMEGRKEEKEEAREEWEKNKTKKYPTKVLPQLLDLLTGHNAYKYVQKYIALLHRESCGIRSHEPSSLY